MTTPIYRIPGAPVDQYKEREPVFPCWLLAKGSRQGMWYRYPAGTVFSKLTALYTHHSPDAPTAPPHPPENRELRTIAEAASDPQEAERLVDAFSQSVSSPSGEGAMPETDAVWRSVETKSWKHSFEVMHTHAEKLERQRDEARLAVKEQDAKIHRVLEPAITALRQQLAATQQALKVAERELAACREELAMFRELVGVRADAKACAADAQHWLKMMALADQVPSLRAQLTVLREEGDEVNRVLRAVRDDVFAHGSVTGRTQRDGEAALTRWQQAVAHKGEGAARSQLQPPKI